MSHAPEATISIRWKIDTELGVGCVCGNSNYLLSVSICHCYISYKY